MKTTILSLLALALALSVTAQTNTFPASGSVGIGTTSPPYKLTLDLGATRSGIQINSDGDNRAYSDLIFNINSPTDIPTGNPTRWTFSHRKDGNFSGDTIASSFEIYGTLQGGGFYAPLSLKSNGDVVLASPRNTARSGNVGIGITNPSTKLHVDGGIQLNGLLVNETNLPNTSVRIKPSATNTSKISGVFEVLERPDATNSATALFGIANTTWAAPTPSVVLMSTRNGTGVTKDIMIWAHDNPAANNPALCIKANSNNIGIGTANPGGYKLAVEGTIGAKKVKVAQGTWADFVFEPGYDLPSLQEVERFVKEHGHLRDVPSAKEVEKDGLDVGEINKRLLQKVEELTLYLLQQQKIIEGLEKRLQQLEGRVNKGI